MYLFFLLLPLKSLRYLGLSILQVTPVFGDGEVPRRDELSTAVFVPFRLDTQFCDEKSEALFVCNGTRERQTKVDVGRGCEEHWKQWSPEWMTAPSKSAYVASNPTLVQLELDEEINTTPAFSRS
ncbi:hypothetical protein JMJ77_0011808 [Colletotrichum scovillei]|uniref:Secreted protein n=1 Tax=Colletotrichum scovillei TaxID=1209932 RepID=A0A9P7QVL4_9PEZI|nr:hypothetical protein JMJ77_0011808 [Colletotrichum scovillei]KAG7046089.1 hypothetical protein JMJ78_0011158 [Colletotrichum scovillei]KAG7063437.1 hypothetical protein JMJ76_0005903 [Colletotrichum scovillei]